MFVVLFSNLCTVILVKTVMSDEQNPVSGSLKVYFCHTYTRSSRRYSNHFLLEGKMSKQRVIVSGIFLHLQTRPCRGGLILSERTGTRVTFVKGEAAMRRR